MNVFTGETVGELRLKVALGSDSQLENFNNKTENSNKESIKNTTSHKIPKSLSRPLNSPEKTYNENSPENTIKILQTFTISIKCLIGLIYNDELTSLICDGTELFVQYHFLDQDSENKIHAKRYKSKNVVFTSDRDRILFEDPDATNIHQFYTGVLGGLDDLPHVLSQHVASGYMQFELWAIQPENIVRTTIQCIEKGLKIGKNG